MRSIGRRSFAVAALAAGVLALPGGSALAFPDPAAGPSTVSVAGTTKTLTPAQAGQLKVTMQSMRAGDTLLLAPGTYEMGYITIFASPGTRTSRIIVRAQDPARPPLLRGLLRFSRPTYWVLDGIRVQATVSGQEAFSIDGGDSWIVARSEFFGANRTGGYSNVTIGSKANPAPRGFRFTQNCLHDAGNTYPASPNRRQMDHNIYVNFQGNSSSGGLIDHNLIFNHPNGAGIKLGYGGATGALGPWGVTISHNTIVEGGRQILLTGDIRNNIIAYNLLTTSRAPFTASPKTTAIYVSAATTGLTRFGHNWFWHEDMVKYDPMNKLRDGGDDVMRPNPGYTQIARCSGWRTTNPQVSPYGRWS